MRPFQTLSGMESSRIIWGFIPLDKIHWYATVELGLNDEERMAFVFIIRTVDPHYVAKKNVPKK